LCNQGGFCYVPQCAAIKTMGTDGLKGIKRASTFCNQGRNVVMECEGENVAREFPRSSEDCCELLYPVTLLHFTSILPHFLVCLTGSTVLSFAQVSFYLFSSYFLHGPSTDIRVLSELRAPIASTANWVAS